MIFCYNIFVTNIQSIILKGSHNFFGFNDVSEFVFVCILLHHSPSTQILIKYISALNVLGGRYVKNCLINYYNKVLYILIKRSMFCNPLCHKTKCKINSNNNTENMHKNQLRHFYFIPT